MGSVGVGSVGSAGGASFFLSPGMGIPDPSQPVICDLTLVMMSSLLPAAPLVGLQQILQLNGLAKTKVNFALPNL